MILINNFADLSSLKTIVQEANKIAKSLIGEKFCIPLDIIDNGEYGYCTCKLLDVNLNEGYVKLSYINNEYIVDIDKFMNDAKLEI